MTFSDVLEIARSLNPDVPAGEIALTLNMYIQDICNEIEPFIGELDIVADGDVTEYVFSELGDTFLSAYMKPHEIVIPGKRVLKLINGINGDIVYQINETGFVIGYLLNDQITPLESGTNIIFEYYCYPSKVTINTGELPMKQAQSILLWRLKADLYAEKREWDRGGYFMRKAERALTLYRRMVQSQGISKIINTNTRI